MDTSCGKTRRPAVRYIFGIVAGAVVGIVLGVAYAKAAKEPVSISLCAGLGACIGLSSVAMCFIDKRLSRSWVARVCYVLIMALASLIGSAAGNFAHDPQTSGAELLCKAIPSGVLFGVIFGVVSIGVRLSKNADD